MECGVFDLVLKWEMLCRILWNLIIQVFMKKIVFWGWQSCPEHSTQWGAGKWQIEGNCQGFRNKENPLFAAARRRIPDLIVTHLYRIILCQGTSNSLFQWPAVLRESSMNADTGCKQLTANKTSGSWLKWVVTLQSGGCRTEIQWLHVGRSDFSEKNLL